MRVVFGKSEHHEVQLKGAVISLQWARPASLDVSLRKVSCLVFTTSNVNEVPSKFHLVETQKWLE